MGNIWPRPLTLNLPPLITWCHAHHYMQPPANIREVGAMYLTAQYFHTTNTTYVLLALLTSCQDKDLQQPQQWITTNMKIITLNDKVQLVNNDEKSPYDKCYVFLTYVGIYGVFCFCRTDGRRNHSSAIQKAFDTRPKQSRRSANANDDLHGLQPLIKSRKSVDGKKVAASMVFKSGGRMGKRTGKTRSYFKIQDVFKKAAKIPFCWSRKLNMKCIAVIFIDGRKVSFILRT